MNQHVLNKIRNLNKIILYMQPVSQNFERSFENVKLKISLVIEKAIKIKNLEPILEF